MSWVVISTVLTVIMVPYPVTEAKKCNFPAIFNFGDSNSDTGGLSAAFGQVPTPNGITFFHTPAGRYSDGRLIIDFLGGVFKKLLPKEEYFSKALYTFDIGHNDITAGYNLDMTTEQVKAYIPNVLDQFSNVIRSVYKEGGRSFWIHNVGPIGCLAYMLDRYPVSAAETDNFGCAKPFNEVSQYFNHNLNETIVQLREELPKATIIYVDVYTVKYNLISHAQKYGFDENSVVACCGDGGKYNFNNHARCGATKIVNGEKIVIAKSCKDPSVKIIWDGIHFTEAANEWIFEQIANGEFSDPPISLKSTSLKIACRGNVSSYHY
ncbi:GDSL esterase/lipase At3g26430-like isoform X3 [Trifolium pratense]|uniref:GDSL esterase/lipase At3g26430-like isoform X3 n=1 Tax=Trifolium pratense TaxID=57577 RepID=UPI001E693935|nr:GDSL esterase/lipase At3g26430-like isoform X3 [Trifolium pratense]